MSSHSDVAERRMVSRRTLVRAGATAVWTVPVIQVVGAAPAFAAVSGKVDLQVTGFTASYPQSGQLQVSGSVKCTGTAPSNLQLTIKLPGTATASGVSAAPTNWAPPATWGTNSVVFTSTGTGTERAFSFVLNVSAQPGGDVTATPSATNQDAVVGASVPLSGTGQQQQVLSVVGPTGAVGTSPTSTWDGSGNAKTLTCQAAVRNPGPKSANNIRLAVTVNRAADSATVTGTGWTTDGASTDKMTWFFKQANTVASGNATVGAAPVLKFGSATAPTVSYAVTWYLLP